MLDVARVGLGADVSAGAAVGELVGVAAGRRGDAPRAEELVRAAVEHRHPLAAGCRDLLSEEVVVEEHEVGPGRARLGRGVGDERVEVDVRVAQHVTDTEVADQGDARVGGGEQRESRRSSAVRPSATCQPRASAAWTIASVS